MGYGLCVLIGVVFGGALVWLICHIKSTRVIEDLRGRLAVSEEKNFRIPKLELALAKNRTELAGLTDQVAALKEDVLQKADKIAGLSLRLVEQTEAAKDKLTMLNDAQSRMCQALIALSETALNCDNDEFIQAMEANLGAFEESLMADISRWQGGARTTTREVCQIADSEQIAPTLPNQDRALEELISPDETADEPEPQPEHQPDIAPALQTELAAECDDSAPDVAVAADAADADDDIEEDDLITERIEADIALLAQRLDDEISIEIDGADNDDDSDAISPDADVPAESPLRFEIEEIPAPPAQSQDELALKDEDEDTNEKPLKKKLNTKSLPTQTRKRVPLMRNLYFPTQGITVRYNPVRGRIK